MQQHVRGKHDMGFVEMQWSVSLLSIWGRRAELNCAAARLRGAVGQAERTDDVSSVLRQWGRRAEMRKAMSTIASLEGDVHLHNTEGGDEENLLLESMKREYGSQRGYIAPCQKANRSDN